MSNNHRKEVRNFRDLFPPFLRPYYSNPIHVAFARGAEVTDTSGKTYLDAYCGVATLCLGHAHPAVDRAAQEQIKQFGHLSHIYLNDSEMEYAARLLDCAAPLRGRVFFVSSGSEAVDLALCLARGCGGGPVVSLRDSYHGGSYLTKAVTGLSNWSFKNCDPGDIFHCVTPKCHLCPYASQCDRGNETPCIQALLETLDRAESSSATRGKPIVIIEPILGVGGVILPPQSYFEALENLGKQGRIILISDEVQTGFGRCGHNSEMNIPSEGLLFGYQKFGFTPHFAALGKGIANGYPLAAVVMTEDFCENFQDTLHFNTFGGNPVSLAAARVTLETLIEQEIPKRVHEKGAFLMNSLKKHLCGHLDQSHMDLRGTGFFIGLETPSGTVARRIMDLAAEKGLLIGIGGREGNVLRIEPPLIFTEEQCEQTALILAGCLNQSMSQF